ncbi:hypothetical protein [Lacisediminimonas profundi]|uniref:hypothetical protein n=1 Tax=Lacisediminimonas profundi TaxID=2603856 RepID=UPI00124B2292|nr:hypothetical protein [Lacisediminimonas profundi]
MYNALPALNGRQDALADVAIKLGPRRRLSLPANHDAALPHEMLAHVARFITDRQSLLRWRSVSKANYFAMAEVRETGQLIACVKDLRKLHGNCVERYQMEFAKACCEDDGLYNRLLIMPLPEHVRILLPLMLLDSLYPHPDRPTERQEFADHLLDYLRQIGPKQLADALVWLVSMSGQPGSPFDQGRLHPELAELADSISTALLLEPALLEKLIRSTTAGRDRIALIQVLLELVGLHPTGYIVAFEMLGPLPALLSDCDPTAQTSAAVHLSLGFLRGQRGETDLACAHLKTLADQLAKMSGEARISALHELASDISRMQERHIAAMKEWRHIRNVPGQSLSTAASATTPPVTRPFMDCWEQLVICARQITSVVGRARLLLELSGRIESEMMLFADTVRLRLSAYFLVGDAEFLTERLRRIVDQWSSGTPTPEVSDAIRIVHSPGANLSIHEECAHRLLSVFRNLVAAAPAADSCADALLLRQKLAGIAAAWPMEDSRAVLASWLTQFPQFPQ